MQRTRDPVFPSSSFLRDLLDSLGESLLVRRALDGELVYSSPSLDRKLGLADDRAELETARWFERVPVVDRPVAEAALRSERGIDPPGEFSFRLGAEPERWLQWQTRRVDLAGEACLVTSIRDITTDRAERERLRDEACRDPLTGLFNRRGLDELVLHELNRSRRSGERVSAILIDLDDFKAVNERFGHAGGDRLLRRVAETVRQTVRPCDPVGRIGGDEFLVVLPGAGIAEACRIAERVRQAIESNTATIPSSASLGVAQVRDGDVSVDAAVRRTQSVLRQGKRAGKNRVEAG